MLFSLIFALGKLMRQNITKRNKIWIAILHFCRKNRASSHKMYVSDSEELNLHNKQDTVLRFSSFIIIINTIFSNYEKTNKQRKINKIIKRNENINTYLTSRQFPASFHYKIWTLISLSLIMLLSVFHDYSIAKLKC